MTDKEIVEHLRAVKKGILGSRAYTLYPDSRSRYQYNRALDHINEAMHWIIVGGEE